MNIHDDNSVTNAIANECKVGNSRFSGVFQVESNITSITNAHHFI